MKKVSKRFTVVNLICAVLLGALGGYFIISSIRHDEALDPANKVELTIVDPVIFDFESTPPFAAPEGSQFVVLQVQVQNNSSQDFYFAPVVQTYLTDKQNNRYDMAPATVENPVEAGVVTPGTKVSGSLSYLVVVDYSDHLIFHFEPNTTNATAFTKQIN